MKFYKKNSFFKIGAFIAGIFGAGILFVSVWPILKYQTSGTTVYGGLISPIVTKPDEASNDLTHARNWFPQAAGYENNDLSKVSFYTISIPKLGIDNAAVEIGGDDLSKNLIQYPGTALPGKPGNAVIFGHSILPIFYDPKNYMSIFSTIPTLKRDDQITVNYDGVLYRYAVETLYEIYPTDIQILQQDISDSFITLVTCIPPGDPRKPKRLIVTARVMPVGDNL